MISILGGANSNLEFRFNDGDTFDMTNGIQVGGDNVVFTDYGSGAAPTLYWTGVKDYVAMIWTRGTSDQVTVQHLKLQTMFGGVEKTNMPDAISASGNNLVIRNNEFEDIGYAVNCNGEPDGVIVEKNDVPNKTALRSYFVWVAGYDHVILGNTVPNSTREAVLRVVDGNRILIGVQLVHQSGAHQPRYQQERADDSRRQLRLHRRQRSSQRPGSRRPARRAGRPEEQSQPMELRRHRRQPASIPKASPCTARST